MEHVRLIDVGVPFPLAMGSEPLKTLLELDEDELADFFRGWRAHQIKELSKKVNTARDVLYRSDRSQKNKNVRQVFYPDELPDLFNCIRSRRVKWSFLLQFFYGLRVGEISRVSWNQDAGVIVYEAQKTGDEMRVPVHGQTTRLLQDLGEFQSLSKYYLRNAWASIREDAGLDYVYAEASDGRDLYNFGTHSLRKTAATYFEQVVDSELKVQTFLGHRTARSGNKSTPSYHWYFRDAWREDLEETFGRYYDLIR